VTPEPPDLAARRASSCPASGTSGHRRSTTEWRDAIRARVEAGVPLLGICLGMQWLFEGSDEAPDVPGLGLLPGRCFRREPRGRTLKVPHVGWNALEIARATSRLLAGVPRSARRSTSRTRTPRRSPRTRVATTTHGERFASGVERGIVFGVQFHPEKSGEAGCRC
jgi:imidazole glycerol-phosphate synthase subunit HisH